MPTLSETLEALKQLQFKDITLIVAWLASVFCTWLATRSAFAFLAHRPAHFKFMALFALTWSLLIAFYSKPNGDPLLPAFGGFLLVLGCGVLAAEVEREEKMRNPVAEPVNPEPRREVCVHRTERLALKLLNMMVPLATIAISVPEFFRISLALSKSQSFLIFAVLMDGVGYCAVAKTMGRLNQFFGRWWFYSLVTIYLSLEVALVAWTIMNQTQFEKSGMGPHFQLIFAGAKILFASTVCCTVVAHGMKPNLRPLPWHEHVMRLFGMPTEPSEPVTGGSKGTEKGEI
jgi:hypothetical protein